ncbi:hypothetical protein FHW69_003279 [Luteibacter sp. Sphag1AF]|uniref:hypothetical protein n=1 Tax=Luteibacter sp. Sphag1AF TaxID=2587031 RepID=UPI00160C10CB|nr:hypothetical protein [Luteibacter sp. Sphag1AF]MBB3228637.1 hypothetical protein [Luteibacter sp. Sphag1AF]
MSHSRNSSRPFTIVQGHRPSARTLSLLDIGESRLEHDDNLYVTLKSGRFTEAHLDDGTWNGAFTVETECTPGRKVIAVARDLIAKHPDYTENNGHSIIFGYEKFGVAFQGDVLNEILSDNALFTYYFNGVWMEYVVSLSDFFEYRTLGPIAQLDAASVDLRFWLLQTQFGPSHEEFVKAVRKVGYIPLNVFVGIMAPGKETVIRTPGSEAYVDTPLGRVPGGLQYIDFSQWSEGSVTYSEGDLKTFPSA